MKYDVVLPASQECRVDIPALVLELLLGIEPKPVVKLLPLGVLSLHGQDTVSFFLLVPVGEVDTQSLI